MSRINYRIDFGITSPGRVLQAGFSVVFLTQKSRPPGTVGGGERLRNRRVSPGQTGSIRATLANDFGRLVGSNGTTLFDHFSGPVSFDPPSAVWPIQRAGRVRPGQPPSYIRVGRPPASREQRPTRFRPSSTRPICGSVLAEPDRRAFFGQALDSKIGPAAEAPGEVSTSQRGPSAEAPGQSPDRWRGPAPAATGHRPGPEGVAEERSLSDPDCFGLEWPLAGGLGVPWSVRMAGGRSQAAGMVLTVPASRRRGGGGRVGARSALLGEAILSKSWKAVKP